MKKTKKLTAEQYRDRYCQEKCMRTRTQLYVAPDIHEKVKRVVLLFRDSHVTAVSLVDAILREHFTTHKEMLKQEDERFYDNLTQRLDNLTKKNSEDDEQ